jgi:LuxR family transcriptional regulator, maltose regulon positive regulatory protein
VAAVDATTMAEAIGRAAPQVHDSLLRRPRLEGLLTDGSRRRVTLVCAPPGFGKTTLLAAWFADLAPGRARWVTAGAGDDAGLEVVLDEVAAGDHEILVIDDAHHLAGEALTKVARLLDDPPLGLDIVLAARADPPIALSRLRLSSRIREIRSAALAFTHEEAEELLRRDEQHLRPADVARLHALTEGWVAGLRLIAYALERGATPAGLAEDETAAQAAVSDYLLAEVLERETPELRRFLLRTSVAERLTPELAVLLADDPHGGSLLEDLHRRGVFVVALDHGWYRYHALFAALLRARLRVEDPALMRELHRSAACWFAAQDMRPAAEAHALAGEHWTLLGDLLRHRWRDVTLAGGFDVKLVDGLPAAALDAEPVLGLLASVEPAVGSPPSVVGSGALADEAAVIMRLRACADGVIDGFPPHRGRDVALRRVVGILDAELGLANGEVDAVLRIAGPLADAGGWIEDDATALLALALAIEGSVGFVRELVAEVTTNDAARSGRGRVAIAATTLATALCDTQQGRRPDRAALSAIAESHRSWCLRTCARSLLACRNATASVVGFDPVLARHPLVRRVLVAAGALDVTDTTGRRLSVGGEVERHLLAARHALATDAPHAALAEAALALAAPDGHPRSVTEAAVIRAAAAATCGDETAEEAALDAVATGGRSLVRAPFVTHAAAVTPQVERLARRPGPHQPAAIDLLELLLRDRAPAWVEPLTERETTVLHLLPSLMSNEEIAQSMHLSVNTVKTHLKALYRKLAVERRRDAVVRARELDLLQ